MSTLSFPSVAQQPKKDNSKEKPNILFIISDDQSYPYASAYGETAFHTPNFDRIAIEGVLFNNAFATSPGCSPSRASLLTGLNTWQLEEAGTHASSFPKKFNVFPDLLEQAGYSVGFTGKGWGPGDFASSGRERNPAGDAYQSRKIVSPEGVSAIDYANNFKDFLSKKGADAPFFFWLGANEPHRPFKKGIGESSGLNAESIHVPEFLPNNEEVRKDLVDFGYEIQYFDEQVGKVLKILEETGKLENTLIVITSDNGMPFPRAKANVYEYGIHVPLAIRWGASSHRGLVADELVSLLDLFSTFIEVSGAPSTTYPVESHSLVPFLLGHTSKKRKEVYAARERHSSARYHNLGYPQRAIRTDKYLYIRNFEPTRWPAGAPQKYNRNGVLEENHTAYHDIDEASDNIIIKGRNDAKIAPYFRLAVSKRPAEELYDISQDSACINNLIYSPTHKAQKDSLRVRLDDYLKATNDPRINGNGEIFETYPRLKGASRSFPPPIIN